MYILYIMYGGQWWSQTWVAPLVIVLNGLASILFWSALCSHLDMHLWPLHTSGRPRHYKDTEMWLIIAFYSCQYSANSFIIVSVSVQIVIIRYFKVQSIVITGRSWQHTRYSYSSPYLVFKLIFLRLQIDTKRCRGWYMIHEMKKN